jgi:hypothetical protein
MLFRVLSLSLKSSCLVPYGVIIIMSIIYSAIDIFIY